MGGVNEVSGGGYGYWGVTPSGTDAGTGESGLELGTSEDRSIGGGLGGDSFLSNDGATSETPLASSSGDLEGISMPPCASDFLDSLAEPPKDEKPTDRTYTVGKGDTLSKIADKEYGDSSRWPEIYAANKDAIGDKPNALKVGTELKIPADGAELSKAETNALHHAAHLEAPSPSAPAAVAPKAAAGKSAIDTTMEASAKGDAAAVVQNMQNLVDATQGPFKADFIKKYQAENGGKLPSDAKVNEAYYDQLMKGFTNARYSSFGSLAGIDEDKLHPVFKSGKVTEMYEAFPNTFVPKGGGESISIPHLLSGIQYNTTSADGVRGTLSKGFAGPLLNADLSEDLGKPLSSQERSHAGIAAGRSPLLQAEFKKDPVQALKNFLDNPQPYVRDGQYNVSVLDHPLEQVSRIGHLAHTVHTSYAESETGKNAAGYWKNVADNVPADGSVLNATRYVAAKVAEQINSPFDGTTLSNGLQGIKNLAK